MQPSFFSLFKRGRYSRPLPAVDDTNEESEQERSERKELERYVAAAIAFCFKHDTNFRLHFCKQICLPDGMPAEPPNAMEIEPVNWADLRLTTTTSQGSTVHVIECKVGARLASHQNPEDPAFAENGGYGRQLLEFAKTKNAASCYVVLGVEADLNLPAKHPTLGISLAQRRWSDLASGCRRSPLVIDLIESLGILGIEPFSFYQYNDMKVTTSLENAVCAHMVLEHTAKILGFRPNCSCLGVQRKEPDYWSFGIDVLTVEDGRLKAENQRALEERVAPTTENIVWFGYESHEGGQRLAVSFYCGTKDKAAELKERLSTNFQQVFVENDAAPGWSNVIVWTTNQDLRNDRDWFVSVFKALGLKPGG